MLLLFKHRIVLSCHVALHHMASYCVICYRTILSYRFSPSALLYSQVEINEKAIRSLFIFNSGKFNFDYTWELINKTKASRKGASEVSISPESGTVLSNTRKRCQLVFCPLTRVSLQGCDLLLRVSLNNLEQNIQSTVGV